MQAATVLLPLVLAFIMFSLGLGLTGEDFKRIVQQPRDTVADQPGRLAVE